jgi:hypothetical protein
VTKNYLEGAASFLTSIKDIPAGAFVMGSLVIIKYPGADGQPMVVIQQLTVNQVIALEVHPEWKTRPIDLLNLLNSNPKNQLPPASA